MRGQEGAAPRWWWGALVTLCLVLFLPGFFTIPPLDRDEARFAQASRQMLESGDYSHIRFQNEERLKKPPGIYWMQAASAAVFGGADIWPYRLPSLLGAVVAVLATAWLGAGLFGARIGFAAAAMLAGCVVLGVEVRMAKTDAVLLATVVIAQGALARVWFAREPGGLKGGIEGGPGWSGYRWPLVFWFAVAVGVLVKGPIGAMVSAFTALGLSLSQDARRFVWLKGLRPWFGLALVLVVAAAPLTMIAIASHGRFLTEAVGTDLVAKITAGREGKGLPPGYYLATFWITFAPFALPAALAVPWAWVNRRRPEVLFCLLWLVPSWLVFEAVPTKLSHYTLPTFPAIALMTAAAVVEGFGWRGRPPWRWLFPALAGLAGAGLLALAASVLVGPWLVDRWFPVVAVVPVVAALVAAGVAGGLLWHRRAGLALAVALGGGVLWSVAAFSLVLPHCQGLWLSRQVADAVATLRPCPTTTLVAAGFSEPSLVFLVGIATRTGGGDHAARHLQDDPACALVVVEREAEPVFQTWLNGFPIKALATFEGFNYSRGKRQTLTLYAAEVSTHG